MGWSDVVHAAVVGACLFLAVSWMPWVLVASTVAYGVAKCREEAHERANAWRRMVVGR